VDVKPSLAVWQDIEGLAERKLVFPIHLQVAVHENQDTTIGSLLDVWFHISELNGVVAQGLNLLLYLLQALKPASRIGHLADVAVEID
jgi:hypothetical protein